MSPSRLRRFVPGAAAVAALLVASPSPCPGQGPLDTFDASIEVRLLELEVVVTDASGEPATGLPREAFEVRLNGARAPILHFSEVDGRPTPSSGAGRAAAPATPPPPTHYLVFIDDLMTLRRNRDFVLERLRGQLDALRPGDSMSVVRFGERKLHVLAPWTDDRSALDAALAEALLRPAGGIKYIALRRMEDYVANWEGNDTRRSVLAAAAALRAVEPPAAGRRALLLLAGSWDPAELVRADDFSNWCVAGRCDGAWVYDVLTDTANQLGYSIYAVDVEGRDPDSWEREKRLQAVLGELARVTGGRRLLNAERRRLLQIAAEDKRSFYALAVRAPGPADDLRRRVEVRVLRPGLAVRTQAAFVPVSRLRARELEVFGSLFLVAGRADEGLDLDLLRREKRPAGRMDVTVSAAFPADALSWPRGRARFAVESAAVDARGDSTEVRARELRVVRAEELQAGDALVFTLELALRRRDHTVAVLVRDLDGEGVLRAVLEIPRP